VVRHITKRECSEEAVDGPRWVSFDVSGRLTTAVLQRATIDWHSAKPPKFPAKSGTGCQFSDWRAVV